MRARLIRIGNSRGIRLSREVIAEAALSDEVDVVVRDGSVIVTPAARPRAGWAEAARRAAARGEAGLLDEPTSTSFDEEVWEWEPRER